MDLTKIIIQKIRENGPVSFHDFMEMALYYPGLGYYTSLKDKIGVKGDYYTSSSLTSAFRVENHIYAQALHFVHYNFCRIHKSLRVTPAMEAKLAVRQMTIEDIVNLVPIEAPKTRGKYKTKKQTEGAE